MREIKFRGKVADEPDEWVYGYLCSKNTIYQEKEHEDTKCCGVGTFKVREETISQYIGLKDKNGVEIYEGDIVKTKWREENIGQVIYEYNGFTIDVMNMNRPYGRIELLNNFTEVIGNIYDNPELLEVD